MCTRAHLIENVREVRLLAGQSLRCGYCKRSIRDQNYVHLEGTPDDGAAQVYRFAYHEHCASDMELDCDVIERNDGCFSYGRPMAIIERAAAAHESVTA